MKPLDHKGLLKEVDSLKNDFIIFNSSIYYFFYRRRVIGRVNNIKLMMKDAERRLSAMETIPQDAYLSFQILLWKVKEIRENQKADLRLWNAKLAKIYQDLLSLAYKFEKEARIKFFKNNNNSESPELQSLYQITPN